MPGLAGIAASAGVEAKAEVSAMVDLMRHASGYISDSPYEEPGLCGARLHLGITDLESQPYCTSGLVVWVEGEIYGSPRTPRSTASCPAATLAEVYLASGTAGLATVNGAFTAAIWDRSQERLHLVTDRYGSRQLFWTRVERGVAWASESKAFLAVPGFEAKIDRVSVSQFLAVGYLLGERTWFEGVELVPSASVMTWDARSSTIAVQRYWWWDKISERRGSLDTRELADEMADLFRQAVKRRCSPHERVGVLLSGGLDSRALLAAASETHPGLPTLTFGRADCADIRLAARAAAVAHAPHRAWIIDSSDWLAPRLPGVWWSEGQYSLLHMHGIEARAAVRGLFSIDLNGFSGDLILGGSYLHTEEVLDRFDASYVARVMRCDSSALGDVSSYQALGKVDYYFLDNRVRRFTQMGTVNWLTIIHDRQPFLDNDLVEFAYSLPDGFRYKSRLYNLMLLRAFPAYYRHIPWQKTGTAIGSPPWFQRLVSVSRRGRSRLARDMPSLASRLGAGSGAFHDYDAWLRVDPARSFLARTVQVRDALLWAYVDRARVERDLQASAQGKLGAEQILRYATLEVWLRQLFTGEYRPPTVPERETGLQGAASNHRHAVREEFSPPG